MFNWHSGQEAKDASRHPTLRGWVFPTKNHPTHYVNRAAKKL